MAVVVDKPSPLSAASADTALRHMSTWPSGSLHLLKFAPGWLRKVERSRWNRKANLAFHHVPTNSYILAVQR